MKKIIIGVLLLSGFFQAAYSSEKASEKKEKEVKEERTFFHKLKPDSITFSTLSYQGALVIGGRYEAASWFSGEISYGLTPAFLGGHTISQLNFLSKFHILKEEYTGLAGLYSGFGILYGIHKDLFVLLPKRYERNYYAPTALRYTASLGVDKRISENIRGFFEFSALDSEVYGYVNSDFSGSTLGTFGFGVIFEYM